MIQLPVPQILCPLNDFNKLATPLIHSESQYFSSASCVKSRNLNPSYHTFFFQLTQLLKPKPWHHPCLCFPLSPPFSKSHELSLHFRPSLTAAILFQANTSCSLYCILIVLGSQPLPTPESVLHTAARAMFLKQVLIIPLLTTIRKYTDPS